MASHIGMFSTVYEISASVKGEEFAGLLSHHNILFVHGLFVKSNQYSFCVSLLHVTPLSLLEAIVCSAHGKMYAG
jgi:hypothetical protein